MYSAVSIGHRFISIVRSAVSTHVAIIWSRMGHLTEIRIEGRGGQGNVVAAYLLAQAGFEAGRFVQAFPSFGPERRGAPVAAFVRISDSPIKRRCQVNQPAYLIIQDPSLLHVPGILRCVSKGGGVLVNSSKPIEDNISGLAGLAIIAIPATAMGIQVLGEPIPNIALLAAFLTLTNLLPLDSLERVLAQRFKGDALDRNLRLMREAAARVTAGSWSSGGAEQESS
jgi:pyruvate ferredoxin oxidoreductase gamma subunit